MFTTLECASGFESNQALRYLIVFLESTVPYKQSSILSAEGNPITIDTKGGKKLAENHPLMDTLLLRKRIQSFEQFSARQTSLSGDPCIIWYEQYRSGGSYQELLGFNPYQIYRRDGQCKQKGDHQDDPPKHPVACHTNTCPGDDADTQAQHVC